MKKEETLISIVFRLVSGQKTINGFTDDMLYSWLQKQQKLQGRENPQIIRHLIVQEMMKDGYKPDDEYDESRITDILSDIGEIPDMGESADSSRRDKEDSNQGEV